MPAYEGRVEFVNAITGDPSGQQLASQFSFQYIPTSFFINAAGEAVDSYTGTLNEADMRSRLDRLVTE